MKKIFTAKHPTEAHMVKGLLESFNIPCQIRGESLFFIRGEIPITEDTLPTVWVDDGVEDRIIEEIMADFNNESASDLKAFDWRCRHCGEYIEGQFTACWKCGREKAEDKI
ncbi:MAG: DUF2007 domain-containing protein [Proteobacteria bacterium]|nr:DUF2007 domain-containing protein [Pseudomonadota bacterium]